MREIDERDCQHGMADTEQDVIDQLRAENAHLKTARDSYCEKFNAKCDENDLLVMQNTVLALHVKALRKALERGRDYAEQVFSGYGFYRPENPHSFYPDHECCTPEEIANHKAACEAFDNGTYVRDHSDGWLSEGLRVTMAPWGIGSYSESDPIIDAALAQPDNYTAIIAAHDAEVRNTILSEVKQMMNNTPWLQWGEKLESMK